MPYLNQITHPDPNTQLKVRYFCDFFKLTNAKIGENQEFIFDNSLSIVGKCIFQLNFNPRKAIPYLNIHFKQLTEHHTNFLQRFKEWQPIFKKIDGYKHLNYKGKVKFISQKQLCNDFKELEQKLEKSMIDEMLTSLISYLRCKHILRKHKNSIEYYCKSIVAEFRFRGHTKKEISQVISRIMSTDINEFPFPKSVLDHKENENYIELKENFLNNRDFYQQISGIKNILDKKLDAWMFFFRINSVSCKNTKQFQFCYDKVNFISPYHTKFKSIKKSLKQRKRPHNFFKNQSRFIIATYEVESHSYQTAYIQATTAINDAIPYFNDKIKGISILDESFVLNGDWNNVGYNKSFWNQIRTLSENHKQKLTNNPFTYLNEIAEELKSPILYYENKYTEGESAQDMAILWEYLENIIPLNINGEKRIKEIVSTLLLIKHRSEMKLDICFDFTNAIFSPEIELKELGITDVERRDMENNWTSLNLRNYSTKFKRPILKEMINIYNRQASKKNLAKAYKYYYEILTESYETRNFIVHSNKSNIKQITKLRVALSHILQKFRTIVFQELKNTKLNRYEEVIEHLFLKGSKLR